MKSAGLCSHILSLLLTGLFFTGALAAPLEPEVNQNTTANALQGQPASVLLVTTFDPNAAQDGQCSLIEAIVNANDDAATHGDCVGGIGADTIVLQEGVYVLDAVDHVDNGNNGLPAITSAVAIEGNGATVTRAIDGNTGPMAPLRIFHVLAGGDLTLNDLTISNGLAAAGGGGGIRNDGGGVTLNRCTLTGNTTQGGNGGGILNVRGAVRIDHSTIRDNIAVDGMGGGVFNENGNLTVAESQVSLNTAVAADSAARGAGLASRADGASSATLTISHSVVTSNDVDAPDGSGGGVAAWSTGNGVSILALNDTLVWANLAAHGGGLWIASAPDGASSAAIDRSAIVGNRASGYGSEQGRGAGIENVAATTVIANSTIAQNAVAGLARSSGGGISNASATGLPPATVRLINATVVSNSALTDGGGIANDQIGAGGQATITMVNTLVAANVAPLGANCQANGGGLASLGHNLEDADTCGFDQPSDLPDTDPAIDLLADNGGPTPTYALPPDSPAVDAGDDAVCAALPVNGVDQRGIDRPQGASCDIGAFEYQETPTAVTLTDFHAMTPVGALAPSVVVVLALAGILFGVGLGFRARTANSYCDRRAQECCWGRFAENRSGLSSYRWRSI